MRRLLLLPLLLAACAPTGGEGVDAREPVLAAVHQEAPAELDKSQVYVDFLRDGQVVQNKPLHGGDELIIRFEESRLSHCRATYNGMPAWSIIAWFMVDGGEPKAIAMRPGIQFRTVNFNVPQDAQELEVWFHNSDRTGCSSYDSNDGLNYNLEISVPVEPGVITFDANWEETVDGPLLPGGVLQIDYAPQRLRSCRATYNGGRTWNIIAGWVFQPGGEQGQAALYDGDYYAGEAAITQPTVAIPEGATSVEMWFSNSDRAGCVDWDSNFNENYTFEIGDGEAEAPIIGWIGNWDFIYAADDQRSYGDVDPAWYWTSMSGQPAATWMEVQVWIPGVTDQRYNSLDAARQASEQRVIAEGVSPAHHENFELTFREQRGNNFVYQYRFSDSAFVIYNDPPAEAGLYAYHVRFSTDGGATYTESERRRFVVGERLDCSLFPDNAPDSCPRQREIGWVGDFGIINSRLCDVHAGLPDEVAFFKSDLGNVCMGLTADVWVAGLTDVNGGTQGITAEVETNLSFSGGPGPINYTFRMESMGRVDNNFRYRWNLEEHVARADVGEFRYRFRFSVDGGANWTIPHDWQTVHVYGSRGDAGGVDYCDDIYTWQGAYSQREACIDYAVEDQQDANACQLYVNGFGRGQFAHNSAHADWLEAYIVVPAHPGVRNAGMYALLDNGEERFLMGDLIEPHYFMTGMTLSSNMSPAGQLPDGVDIAHIAFFVDLEEQGRVTRYWQSNQGQNYNLDDLYAVQGYILSEGAKHIEYVDEGNQLFAQKWVCQ